MEAQRPNIVIIGATSFIAERCARLWVKNNSVNLNLVGRNTERLKNIASDLSLRSPNSNIKYFRIDYKNLKEIEALINRLNKINKFDLVLIAHGSLPVQSICQINSKIMMDEIYINTISPALFAEIFYKNMQNNCQGKIILIGSVAGDRGRKSNYLYGASKGFLERFVEGLQHRSGSKGPKVILVKPGPTDTPMTSKIKGVALADPDVIALDIVKGVRYGKTKIYTPRKWRYIMFIIRHLPNFIFNKLNI
jgi:decaprenylphospho-beta-D-erythro-pentofuranosid-2-ulose 2-reductase